MTKKYNLGFTLVELLAVMVILAIIAIIAVPIILHTTKDSQESANKRSIDLYGDAVKQAVAKYQLKNNKIPKTIDELNVEYKGNKVECEINIINIGEVYLSRCKVKGEYIMDNATIDGYYHYGELSTSDYLALLANDENINNYNDGNIHQMYKFTHEITDNNTLIKRTETDYRFIGNDPYNYVNFNKELWRIVGVFNFVNSEGITEERLKIVRDKSTKGMGESNNKWEESDLNTYLNGEYYNSLTDAAKNMIADSLWYLGGVPISNYTPPYSAKTYYEIEKGVATFNSTYSVNYIGKIGLIYPSDYLYTYAYGVDEICYNDGSKCNTNSSANPNSGWIFNGTNQWTITSYSKDSYLMVVLYPSILMLGGRGRGGNFNVRPSLYLKPSVKIVGGNGEKDNPYQLK